MSRKGVSLLRRAGLIADAGLRLGPRAIGHRLLHQALLGRARRALADAPPPPGPFLSASTAAPPTLAAGCRADILAAATAVAPTDWHSGVEAHRHGLALRLFDGADIRPLWEAHRLAALPLLAQAHRLAPGDGWLARAEALLADWAARNPAFRGPAWACGQEAALRALHLALGLALLGADRCPPPAMRALLALHARRIDATPHYALAQDNNHPLSEAAGAYVLALVRRDAAAAARHAAALAARSARLVAPDGAFAQLSPAYHRLLLDTLAMAEWFRRRHAAPPFPAPFAARAQAATHWLWRLADPATGATPRLGHGDDSRLADLSLAGPQDARGSLERAARLFAGASAGWPEDPGAAWLGLTAPPGPAFAAQPAWQVAGLRGWAAGPWRAMLRTGPLRFRPGHADLLHLELWDAAGPLLQDAGTGAYHGAAHHAGWFAATAAHNTVEFDGASQMPALGRFLFARWPATWALPDGAAYRDHHGREHHRRVVLGPAGCTVTDSLAGRCSTAVLRWRLGPGDWHATATGARSARAELAITADAPFGLAIEPGLVSPAYGEIRSAAILTARADGRLRRFTSEIRRST